MSFGHGAGRDGEDDPHSRFREGITHALPKIMYRYGRRRTPEFAVGAVAGIVSRGLDLLPTFLLAIAIDALFFQTRPFDIPLVPQSWIPDGRADQFALLLAVVGGGYLFQAVFNWVNDWAWNHFAQHLQHEVRTETYDAMQALEMEFYDNNQTGEIMSILNNDVNQLENFITHNLSMGIRIFITVFGTLAVMLAVNWQLTVVAMLAVPVLGASSVAFMRLIGPKYQRVRASVGGLNTRLENNIAGIEVVKSFTTEEFESARVEEASREYLDANWDAITTRIKFFPTLQLVTGFGYLLTLGVGGYWVMFGAPGPFTATLTAGVLVMFLSYTQRFMWPMMQFGQILNSYQYAEAASQRILGLIDQPTAIEDSARGADREGGDDRADGAAGDEVAHRDGDLPSRERRAVGASFDPDGIEGRVAYEGVSFAYDGDGGAPVVRDVSFDVEPGEYVGVVGPTGAGKTTLLKLLLRFYDPDEGIVRIDGRDVREVALSDLRRAIGYVSQDPYLFNGTVRENIAYGMGEVDDEAVVEAAQLASAHGFVSNLPDGYDSVVGERGVKLSGGQRQRIAIARAILKDLAILVLDEATSHVDNETEVLIRNSLDDIIEDRTTFAIAHRLSTVRDADTILVMDDGRVVERGSHEELLDADGLYANLWKVQVGEGADLPESFIERAARRQDAPLETDGRPFADGRGGSDESETTDGR